ncbi:iron chelate uptake ABC transporter family permease subunit [Micromonospora sp. WMMD980]|uniref:iron chelate uptake ABC transporter family permease subunit n=1 Tax=Micromonospora sp. WMMD980 TaxID=3016088 RepID=UPI0024167E2A|nr:iron chelate uptake ABC transporter family permease subunit [Micromonospora sp. WMMD980]MDG4801798.1 iron chelate uptake ABC transporter family permease subunit [Micromonospora sp. WMMD980]
MQFLPRRTGRVPRRTGRNCKIDQSGGGALAGKAVLRVGPVLVPFRWRAVVVAGVLTVLLLAALVVSLSLGTPYVAPGDVLRSLSGAGTPYDLVVRDLRLPRAVLAALAGAAFGVAGTLIQSVARNPLASPDVIGVTQGAGLAATVALTSGAAAVLVAPAAGCAPSSG